MDFKLSPLALDYRKKLEAFMEAHVYPHEHAYWEHVRRDELNEPAFFSDLRMEARKAGLWNLCLPDKRWGPGLSNQDYAPLAEITGRSPMIAPYVLNCQAPDSGNAEIIGQFGSPQIQDAYLKPLLEGEIGSCFATTEPEVASSDASNLRTTITCDGDAYVINGRKWWTGHAAAPRTKFAVVLGVSNPDAPPAKRQSMIIVPMDAKGVQIRRTLPMFGYYVGQMAEVVFDNVRVPAANMLGEEGGGAAIGQARLGPGRIHHAMRCLGMAQRSYELMCQRVHIRAPFGKPLSEQGMVHHWIARSWMQIEQARLLVMKAAWLMDTQGAKDARVELGAVKIAAAQALSDVADRAIQVFGGAGVSDDFPIAYFYATARVLRIGDGPDEVHEMTMARRELKRYAETAQQAAPRLT